MATILCRAVMLIKSLYNIHEALSLTPTSDQSKCGGAHLYSQFIGAEGNRSRLRSSSST